MVEDTCVLERTVDPIDRADEGMMRTRLDDLLGERRAERPAVSSDHVRGTGIDVVRLEFTSELDRLSAVIEFGDELVHLRLKTRRSSEHL